ncbi:hypothetical protein HMSSN139_03940 [Paenibacillus sp. HMSSN-139]|nr:hypothetical protein HMSSN139_03940 [Paenibacillus sp. HMSSN-139]
MAKALERLDKSAAAGGPVQPSGASASRGSGRNPAVVSARSVALQVLTAVEQEGAYSNLLLNGALQSPD